MTDTVPRSPVFVALSLLLLAASCDDFTCADYATCEVVDSSLDAASPLDAFVQTSSTTSSVNAHETRNVSSSTDVESAADPADAAVVSVDARSDWDSGGSAEIALQDAASIGSIDAEAVTSESPRDSAADSSVLENQDSGISEGDGNPAPSTSSQPDASETDEASDAGKSNSTTSPASTSLDTASATWSTSSATTVSTDAETTTTDTTSGAPVLDGPCKESGDLACAGTAQQQRLICSMGFWSPNGSCATGENCESLSGLCEPIVGGCQASQPGDAFCDDDTKVTCEGDLTTSTNELCDGLCVQTADGAVCSIPECGDGRVQSNEGCDDGNGQPGDGCADCEVESGYSCDTTSRPSTCQDIDECNEGMDECSDNATCDNTAGSYTCTCSSGFFGDGFDCNQPPSCVSLNENCGASADDNCCAGPVVEGGDFELGPNPGIDANVTSFVLDRYEVTVGRFRKFIASYSGPPSSGAGVHPLISGTGWDSDWNSQIADDEDALVDAVEECADNTLLSTSDNDRLPMNCVTWYEAFAFCEWDNGRLPTEAEWEYAASGGSSDRNYPWGNTSPSSSTVSAYDDVQVPVGSLPANVGRYGQLDLAGSLFEWVFDWSAEYPSACNDCANTTAGGFRVFRTSSDYTASGRSAFNATYRYYANGFRCARSAAQ